MEMKMTHGNSNLSRTRLESEFQKVLGKAREGGFTGEKIEMELLDNNSIPTFRTSCEHKNGSWRLTNPTPSIDELGNGPWSIHLVNEDSRKYETPFDFLNEVMKPQAEAAGAGA
jgi:hypothetical protein